MVPTWHVTLDVCAYSDIPSLPVLTNLNGVLDDKAICKPSKA
jgi:hypothetical protein